MALGMKIKGFQIPFRTDELSVALAVGATDTYVDFSRCVPGRIKNVNISAGMVDDQAAVGSWEADVEIVMVGMPHQVPARRRAGVQVAVPFVV